jgi:hypothetical protein
MPSRADFGCFDGSARSYRQSSVWPWVASRARRLRVGPANSVVPVHTRSLMFRNRRRSSWRRACFRQRFGSPFSAPSPVCRSATRILDVPLDARAGVLSALVPFDLQKGPSLLLKGCHFEGLHPTLLGTGDADCRFLYQSFRARDSVAPRAMRRRTCSAAPSCHSLFADTELFDGSSYFSHCRSS